MTTVDWLIEGSAAVVLLTCAYAVLHPRTPLGERLYHGWVWLLVGVVAASGIVVTSVRNSPAWLPLSALSLLVMAFHTERRCSDPHFAGPDER